VSVLDVTTADEAACSHCKADAPDTVGLSLLETDAFELEEWGFCSVACMVRFVRRHWDENGVRSR
jgi:hypothetical protein